MNSIQDALYNWLTIYVVCEHRPDDTAAKETADMFYDMLINDHHISDLIITLDEEMYYIDYRLKDENKRQRFPRELIDVMLNQMNMEPEKYVNYPEE
ncbi:hypothetical protein LS684_07435 [Cytobacillus spongiae]|jgi:hypothetical protein|uniref:hypothetical protein n=1 Tax=Cytobacillus spongiae TaxID=2901381 RepID=UPI001F1F677E|nr:hypothetical protein [Cytobacillus spongiae]UII57264.1 hypothetical protein LS684_07435 [Cytobacillus spongiae]